MVLPSRVIGSKSLPCPNGLPRKYRTSSFVDSPILNSPSSTSTFGLVPILVGTTAQPAIAQHIRKIRRWRSDRVVRARIVESTRGRLRPGIEQLLGREPEVSLVALSVQKNH